MISIRFQKFLMGLALVIAMMAASLPAPAAGADNDLQRRLGRAMRADRLLEARGLLLELRGLEPADPIHPYNQACVEARLGFLNAGLSALDDALEMGYDDLRALQNDSDLDALRGETHFAESILALSSRLESRAREAALRLEDGRWSDWADLHSPVEARYRFDAQGIQAEIRAPREQFDLENRRGRLLGGVEMIVAVPRDREIFDSDRVWEFGFGIADGLPVGYLRRTPQRVVETRILELAPRIDDPEAGRNATMSIALPWAYVSPYAPPMDTRYGLNIGLNTGRRPGLIPDPEIGRSGLNRRRYIPIDLALGPQSGRRFSGRLDNSVVGAEPLDFSIMIWSPSAEKGGVVTEILDIHGKSLISSGGKGGAVDLKPGANTISRQADLSALPVDTYRLVTRAIFPDGEKLSWEAELLRLDRDWLQTQRERLNRLHKLDVPTLAHRLDLIDSHLESRDPRSAPTALGVSITEVVNMQTQAEKTGFIFPAGGSVLIVCTPVATDPIFALAHLSAGWSDAEGSRILILPPVNGGAPDQWPRDLLKAHDARNAQYDLAILRPLITGDAPAATVLEACRDWIGDRLPAHPMLETSPADLDAELVLDRLEAR